MARPFSIRRYLLATLLGVAFASMLFTGWWSYREALDEVEELFDAQLAQSARMLAATLTTQPLQFAHGDDDTVVFPVWQPVSRARDGHGETVHDAVGDAGHKYESRLMFQLWEGAGEHLLMRSANAPLLPLAKFEAGYSARTMAGESYHVFGMQVEGLWLQVAQDDYMRDELAGKIAIAESIPHLAGIPVMALLIGLLLARGLRPLDAMRQAIAGRDAANLAPLDAGPASIELKPMVDELNQLLARLGESLERERRFTADAAHELRTPIAVLRIHAENAIAATDDHARRASLDLLLRGVDRAARLIGQLLTLARIEPRDAPRTFTAVRLNALVREELAALVPFAERRAQEFDFAEQGDFTVDGDRALLGILVRNLADNALRYSPPGSLVQVSLVPAPGGGALLRFADEGPGVSPEMAARVFERFFRGDSGRGDGAGLGLAIVSRIVELHGGNVRAVPRGEDRAGCFEVALPPSCGNAR